MPSKLRSETARLNGAKSRGPKTPEGKEISSRNALKHGLTSQSAIVMACESQEEFDAILNQLMEIHKPANAAEIDLVEEMVVCRWRTRRMWGIETTLMEEEYFNQQSQSPFDRGPRAYQAKAFKSLSDDSRSLALAARYETRMHRIYNQAYAILRDLQRIRESKPPASPPQPADPQPVIDHPQPTTPRAFGPHEPPPDLETAKGTQDPPNPPESNTMSPEPPAAPTPPDPQPTAHYPLPAFKPPALPDV